MTTRGKKPCPGADSPSASKADCPFDDEPASKQRQRREVGLDTPLSRLFVWTALAHLGFYFALKAGWVPRYSEAFNANTAGSYPLIEDSYLLLLSTTSVFVLLVTLQLFVLSKIAVRSSTLLGAIHIHSGWLQVVVALFGIYEERFFRRQPSLAWSFLSVLFFSANIFTMWPLLKELRAPPVVEFLFKLGFSFITSFQGIHAIHWGAEYPSAYWLVMPFWIPSLFKLWESTVFLWALLPKPVVPAFVARKVIGIKLDAMTVTYIALNLSAAVLDNCYMASFTIYGPEGFWANSREGLLGPSAQHWRIRLIKPQTGSLTISVVVFLGTLVYRRKLPMVASNVLNVLLASVGPWVVFFWQLLLDDSEVWFPEFGIARPF